MEFRVSSTWVFPTKGYCLVLFKFIHFIYLHKHYFEFLFCLGCKWIKWIEETVSAQVLNESTKPTSIIEKECIEDR